jgi:DNA-binding transcriptional ArsR family regulator
VLHAIADPSRRTILEVLGGGEATAGQLAELLPIARPGVSRHLRVLREAGLVEVRHEAQRRVYSLRPEPLAEVDEWLASYRSLWEQRLSALHTEIARGKRRNAEHRATGGRADDDSSHAGPERPGGVATGH